MGVVPLADGEMDLTYPMVAVVCVMCLEEVEMKCVEYSGDVCQ